VDASLAVYGVRRRISAGALLVAARRRRSERGIAPSRRRESEPRKSFPTSGGVESAPGISGAVRPMFYLPEE
jgi:hypothetical protein